MTDVLTCKELRGREAIYAPGRNFAGKQGTMSLDDVDHGILSVLEKDASLSYKEIARQLNMNESTVRKRILRLKEKKIIRFTVQVEPATLGRTECMLGLKVEPHKILDVGHQLARVHGIRNVFSTLGDYDFCLVVWASGKEALSKLIDQISTMEGVKKVSPSMVVERMR